MLLLRPIREADIDDLLELAQAASFGLTTLPRDRELLARRVARSVRHFAAPPERPGGQDYLFALEDSDSGRVLGTSAAIAKVGGYQPFYAYRIRGRVHHSDQLGVRHRMRVLHLLAEHDGPSEIGSLFLHPQARARGVGRLLSRGRFLYMAAFPDCFEAEVLAELRGRVDAAGVSPFWEAVGRRFFRVDFPTADYLSTVDKAFIADLMPTVPLYIDLLPPAARRVIGRVHPDTAPALHLLQAEGFHPTRLVDIFDAGPIVRARVAELRAVRDSRLAPIRAIVDGEPDAEPALIATDRRLMRCVAAPVQRYRDGWRIGRQTAAALELAKGESARVVGLR